MNEQQLVHLQQQYGVAESATSQPITDTGRQQLLPLRDLNGRQLPTSQ